MPFTAYIIASQDTHTHTLSSVVRMSLYKVSLCTRLSAYTMCRWLTEWKLEIECISICVWRRSFSKAQINTRVPVFVLDKFTSGYVRLCVETLQFLKENSGEQWTFGLIKHRYLVNRSLSFVFLIIECKEFYL